jgi:hypothetical protein
VGADYSGSDLVFGGEPDTTGMNQHDLGSTNLAADAQPLAVLAVLAILIGIGIAALSHAKMRARLGVAAGAAASLFLVLNQINVVNDIEDDIQSSPDLSIGPANFSVPAEDLVETRFGFWFTLLLLLLVVAHNVHEIVMNNRAVTPGTHQAGVDEMPPHHRSLM